ncbi:MAG: 23S rRNA (uracil(1939)-C(5))-methyltransferase RlmD, partial [Firmicutes bacterium]|nr:23S rRNA (uracil(1939)-C(5))-methyltransferase RlmD [Bacillota bacterium]
VNKNEVTHAQELADAFSEAVEDPFVLVSLVVNINKDTVNNIMGPDCLYLAGPRVLKDVIKTDAGTLNIEVSPLSFAQVNPAQCGRLYSKAQEYADLTGGETVLDLYCGTGTIGLPMAGRAARIIGVESVKPAVIDANRNAVLNGIVNAEYICGKAEEAVSKRLQGVKAQVVVLDPPRAGCRPELLKTVADISPERIVYVSCNPSTLARDVKILSGHGYRFVEASPFDMFPFSSHCESAAKLVRM